ncbi:hypothetical protein [Streptomyces sp. HNM0575]|uniref:hypothetical protein n=1 Tax=Streptomyces sp. HNM0575 TaxID=2716338 RepID=UPI003216E4CB
MADGDAPAANAPAEEHPGEETPAEEPSEEDDGPRPLGLHVEPTGHAPVDAQLRRLEDADHLAVSGHLEVYEDVHRGLREALAGLDRSPTGPVPGPVPGSGPAPGPGHAPAHGRPVPGPQHPRS